MWGEVRRMHSINTDSWNSSSDRIGYISIQKQSLLIHYSCASEIHCMWTHCFPCINHIVCRFCNKALCSSRRPVLIFFFPFITCALKRVFRLQFQGTAWAHLAAILWQNCVTVTVPNVSTISLVTFHMKWNLFFCSDQRNRLQATALHHIPLSHIDALIFTLSFPEPWVSCYKPLII